MSIEVKLSKDKKKILAGYSKKMHTVVEQSINQT